MVSFRDHVGVRSWMATERLLHGGDVFRCDLSVPTAATAYLRLNQVSGVSGQQVTGAMTYWHPKANKLEEEGSQGEVVVYKVAGQVKDGKLNLEPMEAQFDDHDEFLREMMFKVDPKGWGRNVISFSLSSVVKHTHFHHCRCQPSWRDPVEAEETSQGCRSRRDAAKLHQEKVQKMLAEGYQRPLRPSMCIDLLGETPMTGEIKKLEPGQVDNLPFSAKLVYHERQPSYEVRSYLDHRKNMAEANEIARNAQSEVVKLLDYFRALTPVAETLEKWKDEVTAVTLRRAEPEPVKILLYGNTGEGKSALVSALLDMPGIAPSDCAGTAVTSCTMIYAYRPHVQGDVAKPTSENSQLWARWLSQISKGGHCPGAGGSAGAAEGNKRFGARLHFLSPEAFTLHRSQLVECVADYWLSERKEKVIQAKLPPNDQHEAYFATQTLLEWYGAGFFVQAGWRSKSEMQRHLEHQDDQIEGLRVLFRKIGRKNPLYSNITSENGAAVYILEKDDPLVFCDQLREWVTVSASKRMAPFLSHVEVFLPNPVLQGVTLIDAAGLGDDNPRRREMAQSLVASSDFVWVLAKISRGLSNQLARKMLRSLSRKVLLDKNSEGEITFILTHSDVLNEAEIAKKGGGSRKALALARAKEVPFKFAQDMERELWESDMGDVKSGRASSVLGAFAISATDYLRVKGFEAYEPFTFSQEKETQVPQVRSQMHMQALKRGCSDLLPLNRLCSVLRKVVAHLNDPGTEEEHRRQRCEVIVRRHVREYKKQVEQILSHWEDSAMDHLHNSLEAKIHQGASKGSAAAAATSNEWAVHSNYHHATYKGMVRRGCTWDHPKRGNLDWPEELAEPVYKAFSKNWRDLFGTVLPKQVSDVKSHLSQALKELHENVRREVVQENCRHQAEVTALQEALDFSSNVACRLEAMLTCVKRKSADVTGTVQQQVAQSLSKASSKCSNFDYASQKQCISKAATNIRFEESAAGMVQGLSFVQDQVKQCCAELNAELSSLAVEGYKPLWRKLSREQKMAWQQLQEKLLPELKKHAEPLEEVQKNMESIHNTVIQTLKALMPVQPGAAPAACQPLLDASRWVNFLEVKHPRPIATPQKRALVDGVEAKVKCPKGDPSREQSEQ